MIAALFERYVYLIALTGFATFYDLERLVTRSQRDDAPFGVSLPETGVFWVHMGSFVVYNTIIGYLLHDRNGAVVAALFAVAVALHFPVNDYGLRKGYEYPYHDIGRWLLLAAVVAVAVIGNVFVVGETAIAVLVAFSLAEYPQRYQRGTPEEFESRWWAFAVGTVVIRLCSSLSEQRLDRRV